MVIMRLISKAFKKTYSM